MKKYYLLILLLILLSDCRTKNKERNFIELPLTKNPTNINQWAVTKFPYLRIRETPESNSNYVSYLPSLALLKVIKKNNVLTTFGTNEDYWYLVDYEGEKGWIFGSYIEIFNDYNEAVKNAEKKIINSLKEDSSKKR